MPASSPTALFLLATATLLFAACNKSTCEMSGERGPWGFHLMQDLPSGACEASEPSCTVRTKDSCEGDKPGPRIDWKCTCTNLSWSCEQFGSTKTTCVPVTPADADAGVSEDDGEE